MDSKYGINQQRKHNQLLRCPRWAKAGFGPTRATFQECIHRLII